MTTFTDRWTCQRDSGLYIKDCYCSDCENVKEEYRELHLAKASAFLSNRPDSERDAWMAGIQAQIKRYEEKL